MKRRRNDLDQSFDATSLDNAGNTEDTPRTAIRKKISFVDESDEEVYIDQQAHKKRKMSQEVQELKLWFSGAIAGLSTSKQAEDIITGMAAQSTQISENKKTSERNANEIAGIKVTLDKIESTLCIQGPGWRKLPELEHVVLLDRTRRLPADLPWQPRQSSTYLLKKTMTCQGGRFCFGQLLENRRRN